MRLQFILAGWRLLTMATELEAAWLRKEEEEEEVLGRSSGYEIMSCTSSLLLLYLLLAGRGSRGQCGPAETQTIHL